MRVVTDIFLIFSLSGMRGRLGWQSTVLLLEGLMVVVFANSVKLAGAIVALVFFSVFVQGAEGASYG